VSKSKIRAVFECPSRSTNRIRIAALLLCLFALLH
jgi:hypothetical protein